jgi:hypothetical protein
MSRKTVILQPETKAQFDRMQPSDMSQDEFMQALLREWGNHD